MTTGANGPLQLRQLPIQLAQLPKHCKSRIATGTPSVASYFRQKADQFHPVFMYLC